VTERKGKRLTEVHLEEVHLETVTLRGDFIPLCFLFFDFSALMYMLHFSRYWPWKSFSIWTSI